jgi:hypothetical protein
MKYVFKQIDNYTPSETTIEFTADSLMTVLEQFEFFLKGSGFYFNGKLDIVNEDEWNEDNDGVEEFETPQYDSFSAEQAKQRWNATIHSLMNPPRFRANATTCEVCGLNKEMMATHHCYDDNCPVHAPQSVCKSEE